MMEAYKVRLVNRLGWDDFNAVKDVALQTMGKRRVHETEEHWLHDLALSEHSPIRLLRFMFEIEAPYWLLNEIRTHHVGAEMFMQSSRNDRQDGFDRNKAPQGMARCCSFEVNLQGLMDMSRVRLCGLATAEAQQLVAAMCKVVEQAYPWTEGLFMEKCAWCGGICREPRSCGRWMVYAKRNIEQLKQRLAQEEMRL